LRAVAEAGETLRKSPADLLSHVVRANALKALFCPAESVESARRALELAPEARLHSQMLFLMNFLPETTPEALYAEACRWNSLYAASLPRPHQPHLNVPDPGRRLRIGYVSPDLREHPVMKFLPPVLESYDHSQFTVAVYSVSRKTDARTAELRGLVESFVPFAETGAALEARIRADRIDILVDLAGHTMPLEYLLVFARKPAPVQISWMGLLSTTGLAEMDYYLGDREMPCPGTEHCFSETVYRLPRSPACYRPPGDPPVAPPPSLERGYVTFGSFNHPAKIGPRVVKVWAEVLRSVPRSRILLKYWGMDTETMRQRYQSWFAREGIARERVQLAGVSPAKEYLEAYGEIDIALDPFPYQGGSTTLDSLWMGLPMVAMNGRLAVGRSTTSILKAVGLPDTIADSPEQYVKAAVFLAGIVGEIPNMRGNIRKALQSSPFMDETGFTRDLEAAYRDMWRIWCRKQPGVSAAPAQT
jgi:predicted O-linked N-acetylglucosamine transferase (SPINDLY family)